MDIATLGCAAVCELGAEQEIKKLRIALGTAAPTPIRCRQAEILAFNKKLTGELIAAIGITASREAQPRSSWRASKEFREHLVKELTGRAVIQAYQNAGGDFHGEDN